MMPLIVSLIRVAASIGGVILLPGYIFSLALFPLDVQFDRVQWFALSGALGVIFTIVAGTILIVTNIGLTLNSWILTVGIFSLIAGIGAWRQNSRKQQEGAHLQKMLPDFRFSMAKLLPSLLLLIVLVAITAVFPQIKVNSAEQFTEFYVFGQNDELAATAILNSEDSAVITLGIVNHEQTITTYRIQIEYGGQLLYESAPIQLAPEAEWESELIVPMPDAKDFVPGPMNIILLRGGESEPYRTLTVWVEGES